MSLIVQLCFLAALLLSVDGQDVFKMLFPGDYNSHTEIIKYKTSFNKEANSVIYQFFLGIPNKDRMVDLISQAFADFFALPIDDQKLLGSDLKQDRKNSTNSSDESQPKRQAYMEMLFNKMKQNATKELLKETSGKFNWYTETDQALEYIKEKDAELATLLKVTIQDGKDHFNMLSSQAAKDLFNKFLSSVIAKRKEITIETFGPFREEYLKLTVEQRRNLVKNMGWLFFDPAAEFMHAMFTKLKKEYDLKRTASAA